MTKLASYLGIDDMDIPLKKLYYFSVAILVSNILVWFGFQLLSITANTFSETDYIVCGLLTILGGVFLLSDFSVKYNWQASITLLIFGVYLLARASGSIQEPWLAKIFGVASFLAVPMLLYITWPGRKTVKSNSEAKPKQ